MSGCTCKGIWKQALHLVDQKSTINEQKTVHLLTLIIPLVMQIVYQSLSHKLFIKKNEAQIDRKCCNNDFNDE